MADLEKMRPQLLFITSSVTIETRSHTRWDGELHGDYSSFCKHCFALIF